MVTYINMFFLEWFIGFFDKFIALVLSQYIVDLFKLKPKTCSVCCMYMTCAHAKAVYIYSASHVDSDTQFFFLLNHDTRDCPTK